MAFERPQSEEEDNFKGNAFADSVKIQGQEQCECQKTCVNM